jgi:ABC-type polysaccharide/polyol phosphate export permease
VLAVMLAIALWYGPEKTADLLSALFSATPSAPLCFALGFMSAVGLYVYYRLFRWLVKLPWREMWG